MLLEKEKTTGQSTKPVLGCIDALLEHLVLGRELGDLLASLTQLRPRHYAAIRPSLLQFTFSLQGPPAPSGQLFSEIVYHLLQFGERLLVGTFIMIGHVTLLSPPLGRHLAAESRVHLQAPRAGRAPPHRLRCRAGSDPGRGTSA